ncbi:hypothetical protein MJD09_05115 [bacterium]|nr:hypothetical protein [bacterium]
MTIVRNLIDRIRAEFLTEESAAKLLGLRPPYTAAAIHERGLALIRSGSSTELVTTAAAILIVAAALAEVTAELEKNIR